jgi:hypothetical protein
MRMLLLATMTLAVAAMAHAMKPGVVLYARPEPYHFNMTISDLEHQNVALKFDNYTRGASCIRTTVCPHSVPAFLYEYPWEPCMARKKYDPFHRSPRFDKFDRAGEVVRASALNTNYEFSAESSVIWLNHDELLYVSPMDCMRDEARKSKRLLDMWVTYTTAPIADPCEWRREPNVCGNNGSRIVTLKMEWNSTFDTTIESIMLPLSLMETMNLVYFPINAVQMPKSFRVGTIYVALSLPVEFVDHQFDVLVEQFLNKEFEELLPFNQRVSARVVDVSLGVNFPELPRVLSEHELAAIIAFSILGSVLLAFAVVKCRQSYRRRRQYAALAVDDDASADDALITKA